MLNKRGKLRIPSVKGIFSLFNKDKEKKAEKAKEKLEHNLPHAIEWAAAEYKYVEQLKQEFSTIEQETDIDQELKDLRKAAQTLKYIGRAERRAYRFEKEVKVSLDHLFKILEAELGHNFSVKKSFIEEFKSTSKELGVSSDILAGSASLYSGKLRQEISKAEADAAFLERMSTNEKKKNYDKEEIAKSLNQLIKKINQEIKDVETWVEGLQAALKKAQQLMKELPQDQKSTLNNKGMELLKNYGFPIGNVEFVHQVKFMASRPSDLLAISDRCSAEARKVFFERSLPEVALLINKDYWPGLMHIIHEEFDLINVFYRELPQLLIRKFNRDWYNVYGLSNDTQFITKKTWPYIVALVEFPSVYHAIVRSLLRPETKFRNVYKILLQEESYWKDLLFMARCVGPRHAYYLFIFGLQANYKLASNRLYWKGILQLVKKGKEHTLTLLLDVLPLVTEDLLSRKVSWKKVQRFCEAILDRPEIFKGFGNWDNISNCTRLTPNKMHSEKVEAIAKGMMLPGREITKLRAKIYYALIKNLDAKRFLEYKFGPKDKATLESILAGLKID